MPSVYKRENPKPNCNAHNQYDGSWWEYDARGFLLCRVCNKCKQEKLSKYRPEVLSDASYTADEPFEED